MTMTVLFGTDVTISLGTFSQQQTVGSFDVSSFALFASCRLSRCTVTIDCFDILSMSTMLASLLFVETLPLDDVCAISLGESSLWQSRRFPPNAMEYPEIPAYLLRYFVDYEWGH